MYDQFLITKAGHQKLKLEIDDLKNVQRPNIIEAVGTARELGDLKENAEYHSSREKQSMIEATISVLEDKLARSKTVDIEALSGKKVVFGATVKIENLDNAKKVTYKIVSDYESDIDSGLISDASPFSKALLGKEAGDEVEINTPGGVVDYEILEVSFIV
ncbi:MAG: transcription elongation factor GreA [Lentimonas sp.]|jgi:transcription elongation factor GreA